MSKQLEQEILRIKRQIERTTSKELLPLLQTYKKSLEQLQGKSTQLINQYIDEGVLHLTDAQRSAILYELEQDIINEANNIGTLELGIATGVLLASYKTGYYRTFYEIERGISVGISFNLLRPEFVNQAINIPLNGMRFSDRIWKNKESMIRRLRAGLSSTIVDGTDPKRIAREISRAYGTSSYESARLVQNEVARATTRASQQVYEDSGVVQQVLFNATLDDVTTETCQELDGEVFPLGREPSIPDDTHIGCRSVLVPMIEGWNPTRRKDNISKDIVDYKNYGEWAKDKGIN